MGTKVHCESYLPGFCYSMRDLNEDSSSSSWPVCYGDKAPTNGQYYNGFIPRTIIDGYPGHGKDALKQKMLEHEAVFRNQVYELHRLYRIQRDMMEEFKRKEIHGPRASMEQPLSSSSLRGSQMPSQDARKWHMSGFPLLNSGYDRTSISGVEIENSPMSCTMGYNATLPYNFPFRNESSPKEPEPSDSRPLKVRKKLFDLRLPADEYMDEEGEKLSEIKAHSASIRLVDLNEPVGIEEGMGPSTVDFLDHGSINGEKKGENHHRPVKSDADYLGVNEESLLIRDGSLVKSSVESRVNERGWLSHLHEAGSSKSNISSVTHNLQKEKMSILFHPVPGMLDRADSHPFFSSSCFASSRHHSVPFWANPTSSSTQKLTTTESRLGSPRNLHTSSQIGEKSLNPGFVNEITAKNGFYHGSASKSSETSVFDYLNCSRADNVISDHSGNHAVGYFSKSPPCLYNSKPGINIDLNEAADGKSKTKLPWLIHKPAHANGAAITDLNQPFTLKVTSNCEIATRKGVSETQNVKKILGFSVFETGPPENVPSSSASIGCPKNAGKEKRNGIIDINLECEPDEETSSEILNVEKGKKDMRDAFVRDYIDLNSCISDFEEDVSAPSCETKATSVKRAFEIDLEAPVENEDDMLPSEENMTVEASLELLQNKNEPSQDEILKNAAEIMVDIASSSCMGISTSHPSDDDASLSESIIWLVDQLVTNISMLKDGPSGPDGPPREEMDEFEAMTLLIQETKEEDYMPAPFVPEFQNFEKTGPTNNNTLVTRSRRGQSRRGRQRRDFQRDILPGLVSLSRHEVTEDIQTFGGLMRATGHHWVSGLTRRNGGGRGRRRAVIETVLTTSGSNNQACTPLVGQVSKNVEGVLEDRSLTWWGKTTRRPRRQRCPTGNNSNNPPAVVLT